MNPKVSIIVPVFNLELYLHRCLDSLIHQTYNNIEIIVVNDGSKDKSISIINKYAEQDKRFIVIDKKNEGVSVARNEGINKANGKYIMFVDGDDWIDCDMIEKLVETAEKTQSDFVGAGFIFEDLENNKKRCSPDGFTQVLFEGKEILKNYLVGNYIWSSVWGGIYLLETIVKNNIYFAPEIKYAEDVFFTINFMAFAKKIIVREEHFYHVLVRASSVTRNSIHELDKKKKRPNVEEFLKKNNLWDEYKDYYKAWFVRFSNYELYHLALKVNYKIFRDFYNEYTKTTDYKKWNNYMIRKLMSKKHRIMSLLGRSSIFIWLSMNIPTLLGKKIIV
ncbi:glycosyltransferase [uncultured Bacteroides sp.]|uniref:glycosyltransferase n=1 Tax=uncultured Bacteroides sp. TaxID=162156 RepID=UPI002610D97A|nr:glycosyltransferase [uncultured Bacteroides sp.]